MNAINEKQFPKTIGPFVRHDEEPNAISHGALYNLEVEVDVPNERKRMLRVYLPEDYDPKKSYPVIYMADAQNAVDKYLTAYGEWDIDDHIHVLLCEGFKSFLVVGLDCPKSPMNRSREYVLTKAKYGRFTTFNMQYGDKYAAYMVDVVKPLIDKTFSTRKEKEFTAFCGSSMGGMIAYDISTKYHEVFGMCLSYSPAFKWVNKKDFLKDLESRNFVVNDQKYYFFCGGLDLDAKLLPDTKMMVKYMQDKGYDEDHLKYVEDLSLGHNEVTWSQHFCESIRFWNIKK